MEDSSEIKLNDNARKALYKSSWEYIINNILIVLVPMTLTIIVYCLYYGFDIHPGLFWDVLKKPVFFIPVLIAIFVKDILKYVFCGMSESENKYLEEAEKENPEIQGLSDAMNSKGPKSRFMVIVSLFGVLAILIALVLKRLFNIVMILSFAGAYLFVGWHKQIPYNNYHDIIFNLTFLISFFIILVVLASVKKVLFPKPIENNPEESENIEEQH